MTMRSVVSGYVVAVNSGVVVVRWSQLTKITYVGPG